MAFSFDMDIYSWLLEDVLKVSPSGDPVNDAVYLILLPMVVLYMYADFVISKSRFMGSHGKFKYIMMFVVGFVIVREGYYAFFASMSLPLLGLIMIWHAFSFIMGWGQKGKDTTGKDKEWSVGWRSGGGSDRGALKADEKSILASGARLFNDLKHPTKSLSDRYVVELEDIERLKQEIELYQKKYVSMGGSHEGSEKAIEISSKLMELVRELNILERQIEKGEDAGVNVGDKIKDIESRLTKVFSSV